MEIYAGLTPMVESECKVDGAFKPNHSTPTVVGAAPSAGGLDHTCTRFSFTACSTRLAVVAVIAITMRFSKFPRVTVNVPVFVPLLNLNLCPVDTVAQKAGGRKDWPED